MSRTVDPSAKRQAERMARELADRWATAPYFRSADGVSYTPRGQLRGFLSPPRHPLGQAMLRFLFEIALLEDPSRSTKLLQHALEALPPEGGRLARTLRHLSLTHAEALEEVRNLPDRERLREGLLSGDPTKASPGLEESFRAWQENWISAAG